ncbi:MAG: SCO family protein [Gammaproteobacteria bacterium]|nr:SCO family protein [Gammaproteobacteria bacterium]
MLFNIQKKILVLVITSVGIIALASGVYFSYLQHNTAPPELAQTMWYPAEYPAIPAFNLVDQHGQAFTEKQLQGQWHLLFFGYTHCPDVCPMTLHVLKEVQTQLDAQQLNANVKIILVSADPQRDTPVVLSSYLNYFDPRFIGLTGDLTQLQQLARSVGAYFAPAEEDTESIGENPDVYNVDHSAGIFMINPKGKPYALLQAPHDATQLTHNILTILEQP